jgi:hypothetical protein
LVTGNNVANVYIVEFFPGAGLVGVPVKTPVSCWHD